MLSLGWCPVTEAGDGFWTPPENLGTPINTGANELSAILADSGNTLYFSRTDAGQNQLYRSRRDSAGWGRPAPLTYLNTAAYNELNPALSADGSRLYFVSDRPGGHGGFDVWVATWNGRNWVDPVPLGPTVNTDSDEWHATPGPDGLYLSARPEPGSNRGDVYFAAGNYPDFMPRLPIPVLATPAREMSASLSADGTMLLVASDRPGSVGLDDLWHSTLENGTWSEPVPTPCGLSGADFDQYPTLSPDGVQIHFSSDNRPEGYGGADLYVALWHATGDMNGDRKATSADIVHLVRYLFDGGPGPADPYVADPNCDGSVNVVDVVVLVNYILRSGDAPCTSCATVVP